MAGITGGVSGVLSSSEITSLIQQSSAAFQLPVTALQNQEQPITTQITALGQVQSSLSSLQSALGGLANVQNLSQRSVSSTSGVSATATNAAAVGSYSLSGIHLATAETLESSGFTSTSGSLGSGSITLQVGSGTATTLSIAAGQDTLGGIASTINSAGLNVTANVVFDGTKYHLMITSNSTGAANAFAVTGTGGLSGLSYNATSQNLTQVASASNATFSLNGISITSGSNIIKNAIQGLTLTLASSGSATVSVSQDSSALTGAAQSVVSALNAALGTINKYASFSTTSGAGPLLGDVGLQILRTDLLNSVSAPITLGATVNSPFNSLGAIGFTVTSGGTVTLDTAKLQSSAQQNYQAVAALLGSAGLASNSSVSVNAVGSASIGTYNVNVTSNSPGSIVGTVGTQNASGSNGVLTVTDPGPAFGLSLQIAAGQTGNLGTVTISQGLFGIMSSILNGALNSETGSVPQEVTNLSNSLSSLNKQITLLQQQAQQETQLLTQQFSDAQSTISQLTTVSNFLSAFFNQSSGAG